MRARTHARTHTRARRHARTHAPHKLANIHIIVVAPRASR